VLLVLGMFVTSAQAAFVHGDLSFTGSVRFTSSAENFAPFGGTAGTGTTSIVLPSTGDFAPLAGSTGSILDLNRTIAPVNSPLNLASFLTFTAAPDIRFDLTLLSPGVFGTSQIGQPPAAGQTATPAGSHYNMVNTAQGSTLSFDVLANAVRISTGETTPYRGVFTAQFAGQSFQGILTTLAAGGFADSAFSANFAEVPEPVTGSLALCAVGLLALRRSRGPNH